MAEWEGKSKGTPLGYKIFIFTIRTFGLSAAYLLLYPVATYYVLFARKARAAIEDYFYHLQSYSNTRQKLSAFRVFYNFGQILIDKTAVLSMDESPLKMESKGREHLRHMAESGSGGFLISAHIGSWEIAGQLLNELNVPINIVLLDGEQQQIKKVMEKAHSKRKFNIIPIKEDMSHMFLIHQAARNKELICIHGDRFLPGSRVITANFLGEEAAFPQGPFAMAAKLKLPTSFVFGMKKGKSQYQFYCTPPLHGSGNSNEIFKNYLSELESMTEKYPEQWFNFYPFWKKLNT